MTQSALTIGLMTPSWPGMQAANGITTAVFNLVLGLIEIGHRPVILTEKIEDERPETLPDVPVVKIERHWRLVDKLRSKLSPESTRQSVIERSIIAATHKAMRDHGIDVLIMEESFGWAGPVSDQLEIPVIVALHGPWELLSATSLAPLSSADHRRIAREAQAFAHADGLLAPSEVALSSARAAPGTAALPQKVIPNALKADPFQPRNADRDRDRSILFVGRFDTVKGGDVVIEAFGQLHEHHPEAKLTFVGPDRGVSQLDGSLCRLEDALATLPKSARERITCTGLLSWKEIEKLRDQHAIALIASRFEVFGYTLAEALAAGQAVVCTDMGGPGEFLINAETALLVTPGEAEEMAQALSWLLTDDALRHRLAKSGHTLLEQRFAPSVVAAQTVDFLRPILDNSMSLQRRS